MKYQYKSIYLHCQVHGTVTVSITERIILDANIMKNQEITNKLTKKKIRFIDVAPAIKKEIAAEVGCTVDTVNNALNLTYPTYGEQPDRIRRMARERGGFENTKIRWVLE